MRHALKNLIERFDDPIFSETNVISWGAPVPAFGDLSRSHVATLGLNPSNREFVDTKGEELSGTERRFHTLKSLHLAKWSEVTAAHLKKITDSCDKYFCGNPYNGWFKDLNDMIAGTNFSYYGKNPTACHLDLIPYATECKWTDLTTKQRLQLLNLAGDTLGLLLQDSPVKLLVLNGRAVVENLEKLAGTQFLREVIPEWTLPRKSNQGVPGIGYSGTIKEISGIPLDRQIHVLGYNHNIQSSYGVTKQVKASIQSWIAQSSEELFCEA
jgi:hypothetical protein